MLHFLRGRTENTLPSEAPFRKPDQAKMVENKAHTDLSGQHKRDHGGSAQARSGIYGD